MTPSREDELLHMLGRWQDLALELGFAAGTGPREISRKVARVIRAADALANYEPDPDASPAELERDQTDNRQALRQALADYHAATRRRQIAETLAAEPLATSPLSDAIQARIDALKRTADR